MGTVPKDVFRGMRVAGDPLALKAAAALAARARQTAREGGCRWQPPRTALHPDGSVELVWESKAGTALVFWFPVGECEKAWLQVFRRGHERGQRSLTLAEGAREVVLILDPLGPCRKGHGPGEPRCARCWRAIWEEQNERRRERKAGRRGKPLKRTVADPPLTPPPPQWKIRRPDPNSCKPGEGHKYSRYSDAEVKWLREMYAAGLATCPALAAALGMSELNAWKIIRGRARKQSPGPVVPAGFEPWVQKNDRLYRRQGGCEKGHGADAREKDGRCRVCRAAGMRERRRANGAKSWLSPEERKLLIAEYETGLESRAQVAARWGVSKRVIEYWGARKQSDAHTR